MIVRPANIERSVIKMHDRGYTKEQIARWVKLDEEAVHYYLYLKKERKNEKNT